MASFCERGSTFTVPAALLDQIQAVLQAVGGSEMRELLEQLDTESQRVVDSLVWTAADLEDFDCLPRGLSAEEACQQLEAQYSTGDEMQLEYGMINAHLEELCERVFRARSQVAGVAVDGDYTD